MPPVVGGSGGGRTGLAVATAMPPVVGGSGGGRMGLAIARFAPVTRTAARTAKRNFDTDEVMDICLLLVQLCTKRVTEKRWFGYNKSNYFVNYERSTT
jgi:hypothetical protein